MSANASKNELNTETTVPPQTEDDLRRDSQEATKLREKGEK